MVSHATVHANGSRTVDTTQRRKIAFLAAYRDLGIVRYAAEAAGVNRTVVYDWRNDDPAFADAWKHAQDDAVESLEHELWRRGRTGWEEPVYQAGQLVGTVRKYSDACLIFALKALAPAKYRERYDITTGGQPLVKAYVGFELAEVGAGEAPRLVESTVIETPPELPQPQQPAPTKRRRTKIRK